MSVDSLANDRFSSEASQKLTTYLWTQGSWSILFQRLIKIPWCGNVAQILFQIWNFEINEMVLVAVGGWK